MEPDRSARHRKTRPDAPPGFFAAEAAGLRWLAEAEAVGGASVVRALEVGEHHIDLQRVHPVAPTGRAAERFGRALAVTHTTGAEAFGSPPDGWSGPAWIGRQTQTNEPTASWGRFYAEQRVRPFVHRAVEREHLGRVDARVVDAVCDRIAAGEFDDDRPPARIHGDLWSGNVLFTASGVVLIDPAAHGGHGLTDLAMLELFGCPQLSRVLAAYDEMAALPDDWSTLVNLHQLHPLAVHTASHGSSYAAPLLAAARALT